MGEPEKNMKNSFNDSGFLINRKAEECKVNDEEIKEDFEISNQKVDKQWEIDTAAALSKRSHQITERKNFSNKGKSIF